MSNVQNENNFIFSGFDTVKLAKKYGTPLYVMSEDIIKDRCKEIKEDFLNKHKNTKAAYASKAFLTLAMCKIVEREGLYLDVVSGGELYTAIKADFPKDRIMFHGNNKSLEEIKMAIENNIGRIVVDNLYELSLIEDIASEKNKQVGILFRISPEIDVDTHKYIVTGQKDSKFGIPLEEEKILESVKNTIDSNHINLKGFHFHLGSQLFENDIYVKGIEVVVKLMRKLRNSFDFEVLELNVGGGFGVRYTEKDDVKPLKFFTDAILKTTESLCLENNLKMPTIIIEPGRWIVADAGITLYTIGSIKEINGIRTYASIDGGFPDNPRPALYGAKYEGIVANKIKEKNEMKVTIAGKCCESGDILIWDLEVPKIESGDILAVKSTGAYNFSMASNYNKVIKPPVVLLSDGKENVIVQRENYEDLIRKDLIPRHLEKNSYLEIV